MMKLLPKPYPDEAVGSILLRGRLRTGLELKPFLNWVFDTPGRSSASLLLGSNIVRIAAMCGVSASTLLDQHTVFPYATAFQTQDQVTKLRDQLLDKTLNKVGAVAPLVANSAHQGYRRLCLDCVAEDLADLGESYWRRTHQISTVLVCTKHDLPLVEWVGASPATLSNKGLALPHQLGETRRTRIELSMDVAKSLARLCESLLNWSHHLEEWKRGGGSIQYVQRALVLGFAYPAGGAATGVVSDSLARFYGERFLDSVGCHVNNQYGNAWPALLLRRSSYQATTTRHVLLCHFLSNAGLDDAAVTALTQRRYTVRDYPSLDFELARRLRAQIKRMQLDGSKSTATQILKSASSYGTFKHNRHRLPVSREVLELFRRSPYSVRRVLPNTRRSDPKHTKAEALGGYAP